MRQLWIARINAAARMNGLSYSKMMHGLKLAEVDMNRKMLAELAVSDKEGFATLAALAKRKSSLILSKAEKRGLIRVGSVLFDLCELSKL